MADNEQIFLEAATTDEKFREALRDKNRKYLSQALDDLGIVVANKEEILDAIIAIDWMDLKNLEVRLLGADLRN
jgi:hypothetical protein